MRCKTILSGMYFTWLMVLFVSFGGILAGIILGSIFASSYVTELDVQNRWVNTSCYVSEVTTTTLSCKGTCFQPQWTVSFIDNQDRNVTTFCLDPTYSEVSTNRRNISAALEYGNLKAPVGSTLPYCAYDPASVDKCRTTIAEPQKYLATTIGVWVGLVGFPAVAWPLTLFARSRCCTKDSWGLF